MAPSPNGNTLYECAPVHGQLASWKDDTSPAVFETCAIDTSMSSTSATLPSTLEPSSKQGVGRVVYLLKELWHNPKYFRWVATLAVATMFAIFPGFFMTFGTLYMYLRKDLQSTAVETGWVASLGWSFQICSPIVNALYQRFGPRKVAIIATILCAIGILCSSFAESIWPLYASFGVVFGIGNAMIITNSMNLVTSYFESGNAALPTTLPGMGGAIGMLIWSSVLEMSYERFGWRTTLRCYTALLLVIGLLCSVCLKRPSSKSLNSSDEKSKPVHKEEEESLTKPSCSTSVAEDKSVTEEKLKKMELQQTKQQLAQDRRRKSKENYIRLLKDPAHWMFCLATMLSNVVMVFNVINLVEMMASSGYSAKKSAMFMSILSFVETGSRFVTGISGDRLPCARILVVPVVCLVCGCGTFALTVSTSTAVIITYVTLAGMGRAVSYSIIFTSCIETFGHAVHQESFSFLMIAYGIGSLLAAVIPGLSYDLTGSYHSANYCGAAMWLVSAALYLAVYLLKNRQNRLRYTAMSQIDETQQQERSDVDACKPVTVAHALTDRGDDHDLEGALEALKTEVNDASRMAVHEYYVIVDKISTV